MSIYLYVQTTLSLNLCTQASFDAYAQIALIEQCIRILYTQKNIAEISF